MQVYFAWIKKKRQDGLTLLIGERHYGLDYSYFCGYFRNCLGIFDEAFRRLYETYPKPHHPFFMILSFGLLAYAMKSLPLGTAYTIWTGIGAIGSFLVGIFILGEPATAMRMLAAVLIVSGLVLMKLSSG